jgi:HKD family nuclease
LQDLQVKFLQISGVAFLFSVILGLKNREWHLMTKDLRSVTKITFHSVSFRYKII